MHLCACAFEEALKHTAFCLKALARKSAATYLCWMFKLATFYGWALCLIGIFFNPVAGSYAWHILQTTARYTRWKQWRIMDLLEVVLSCMEKLSASYWRLYILISSLKACLLASELHLYDNHLTDAQRDAIEICWIHSQNGIACITQCLTQHN